MEDKLLFDYFFKVVGTPMDRGHKEICLFECENKTLKLVVYVKAENNGPETSTSYLVDDSNIIKELNKVVRKYKMAKWNKLRNPNATCGGRHVFKFRVKDELIRVPSDAMPNNGLKAFGDCSSIMYGYVDKNKKI